MGVQDAEAVGVEEEEEEEEMVKEEVVATQDLECERYVGQGNMTTLTVSSIIVDSGSHL